MSIYTMEQTRLEEHDMPLHAATDPFPLFPETAMMSGSFWKSWTAHLRLLEIDIIPSMDDFD
ncbi:LPXTG-motif cell wall anchor domain protein [Aspergillus luchuensis]|uniref:LPXTG-motif cell wall anchor domain protein n=1 Tax=Aspergillus kawachii TaxID=1069201 RepID=A0A146F4T9_ASPKA|nr:LPXTG-motif cell wall anchor domain protein [Aspergillus luchuensis]